MSVGEGGMRMEIKRISEEEKEDQITAQIMDLSRCKLLIQLKYFSHAVYALPFRHHEQIAGIGTDGNYLYYGNYYAIQMFKHERNRLNRDCLHTLLHCLFRHFDVGKGIQKNVWDLSCDIAVENVIRELNLRDLKISQDSAQMEYISALRGYMDLLSAEKIYHYFMENDESAELYARLDDADNRKLHGFSRDDHTFWYAASALGQSQEMVEEECEGTVFEDLDINNADRMWIIPDVDLAEKWKKIAEIVNVDLETATSNTGINPGTLSHQLRIANRDRVDYREFLRKFAVYHETIGTNQDEFDYVYYTYGMSLYGDMPLIEPLEYKEEKRIREFVIALDTSGSVSEPVVKRFVESTFSILKGAENFFSEVKVYIIQCDARVQHVEKLGSEADLRRYMEEFAVYGYGGTDFRPVFEYIEELRKENELTELEGMIYFTDGLGIYPPHAPEYKTAFVFTEDSLETDSAFPTWAMRVILTEEEIDML